MTVQREVMDNCFACHEVHTAHFDAPPGKCATCHVPFAEMPSGVTAAKVATWKAPTSHESPDFQTKHGDLAAPIVVNGTSYQVSPACATCHAREYCVTCHVNAPEVPEIQALQPDPRSLAMKEPKLEAPASHDAPGFLTTHGRKLSKKDLTLKCGTCHTATSCEACHQVPPQQVRTLAVAGPGRGAGATVTRARPASHGTDFTDGHAQLASGSPQTCAGCHVQEQCLQCHRPNAGTQGTYHPADYISRHPVAAYGREASMLRLPQSRPVLPDLPCAERHRRGRTVHRRSGSLPRWEPDIRRRSRPGRSPRPGELRELSRREGLHGVPLIDRRKALQSARAQLPRRKAA